MALKINKYGFLSVVLDDDGPKNETLEEHKKVCKAKPGNCPFEKKLEKDAEKEDLLDEKGGGDAPEKKKVPDHEKFKKISAILSGAFLSAGKSVGEGFVDPDMFNVVPSKTWDPEAKEEVYTGGYQLTAVVNGGEAKCNEFLDKLKTGLGVSRKTKDFYADGESGRINTHLTPEEAVGALKKIAEYNKVAAEKKKAAEEEEKKKADVAKRKNLLSMVTHAVTNGAKSVNFHVKQGDFAPDKTKVDVAIGAKGDVEDLLGGKYGELDEKEKAQAEALQKAIGEINESYYNGKHNAVSNVPQYEGEKPAQPKDEPKKETGKKEEKSDPPTDNAVVTPEIANAHSAILAAAKTINYHIEKGDFSPNSSKLAQLKDAAKYIHGACPDGKSDNAVVQSLYNTMVEIAESAKNGWKNKIGMVKPLPSASVKTASGYISPLDKILGGKLSGKGKEADKVKPSDKDSPFACDSERWMHMKVDKPADYFKSEADKMTVDEATSYLNGIGVVTANSAANLMKSGYPEFMAAKAMARHVGVSGKMFDESVKCAAVAIKDLSARFPNMKKCFLDAVVPSKPKAVNTSAEWVKGNDNTAEFSTICFHADYDDVAFGGEYSYGHKDSRLPFDIFRHEYMHGIATGAIAKEWKKFIGDNYGKPCTGFFNLMQKTVSGYAASGDIYESLAETFAKVTSHDYVPGTLPFKVEDFIYGNVLGCEPAKKHLIHDPNEKKSAPSAAKSDSLEDVLSLFVSEKKQEAKQEQKASAVKELAFA